MPFLDAANQKISCPPGGLPAPNQLKHVVIASMMKSGTHMVINLILNNFTMYRHAPLYINLDQYLFQGHSLRDLLQAGGSVIKSQFPQSKECDHYAVETESFLRSNKVILVSREREQIKKSLGNFGDWGAQEVARFELLDKKFHQFWDGYQDCLRISHADLVSPQRVVDTVHKIAEFLELTPTNEPVGPRPKNQRIRILTDNFFTRLLGKDTGRINTGIRLSK